MISDHKLNRLAKAAENLTERETESSAPRKATATPLDKTLATPIVNYLLAPYEHGFWEFRANWSPSSALAKYLLNELGTLSEIEKDVVEATPFLPSAVARKLSEEKREELLRITGRLSSINALFRAAIKNAEGSPVPKFSALDTWAERVDLPALTAAFPQALRIFQEHIYFDGFTTGFVHGRPYRIKSGLITLLQAPRNTNQIHVIAMGRTELSALCDFYGSLGTVTEPSISRVFAPDEELFRPYFHLVSSVLNHVIQDGQISNVFSQALAYYEEEDFQHCISSLGLIAEDYLQRVYTTLLREPLPGGLTLGQTLERLHRRIDDLLPPPKNTQRSIETVYEQIKALSTAVDATSLQPLLRELVAIIHEDRQHFGKRIDEITKPGLRRSVFPSRLSEILNELLKWRNAASHNSRIPLGAHEADRMLFCLISVITWWQEQLSKLDWTTTRIDLIELLLQTAKTAK